MAKKKTLAEREAEAREQGKSYGQMQAERYLAAERRAGHTVEAKLRKERQWLSRKEEKVRKGQEKKTEADAETATTTASQSEKTTDTGNKTVTVPVVVRALVAAEIARLEKELAELKEYRESWSK